MSTWIKLHRQAIENDWLKNPKLWAFWCYCLLKATYKPKIKKHGFQDVPLVPGQFIFGRKSAAKDLEMSERSIRTCLDSLKNSKNVTIKTTNKYSVITVTNWDKYQDKQDNDDQQNDQQPTSNRPATDHKQEVKNIKNKEENTFMQETFDSFWNIYPKKQGKALALKSFMKLGEDCELFEVIWDTIELQKNTKGSCLFEKKFVPHFSTYLDGRRWEDEIVSDYVAPRN